ncbi:hypothetical protein CDQ84_01560 [Clostridium thermosuccinogenes]|uniref:Glycosyltransferase 2-like domain-containing protein n=1 Tax=Clostridium thermosuccinogenes TaxID=84032 RepID=A0A2K2FME2_9CLOT|nr:glycosyltransferase [Pseudoclostridium thermosuccinogenes]AUS95703.1 hypothetical protein CDO33_04170 [Pseudoclostridium thermosuccinogenes]PNT99935.1 hypothetical protein CDQ85_01560 [Pseudoclostridium thermosuccinogenes]PNU01380.1 hypothetical protein CDQ84_01560 [Pseudoclostridium thermosuccinogenes]
MVDVKRKNIKVSVVMPVFNAERYLPEAVDSLLNQTLEGMEIILVNDGSTDGSGRIAEEYASRHENVTVIHQQNQGVSVARNAGIARARGEYIGFADADDWLEPNAYERMYEAAKAYNCDIISCDFFTVNPGAMSRKVNTFPFDKGRCIYTDGIRKEILPFFIRSDAFASPFNKIYRLDFIKKNGTLFPEGIRIGEDYLFNMMAFTRASTFFHIPEALYNYRIVEGSATNNIRNIGIDNYISLFSLKNSIIREWDFISFEAKRELAAQWFVNAALTLICRKIYYGGMSGIIEARRLTGDRFIRDRIKELSRPLFYESRFMNYVFHALYSKSCLKIALAVYYVKYISPLVAKMRGNGDEKKAAVCNR